jgi:hypothetical protein
LADLSFLCNAIGVFVQVVPEGMDVIPPSENVTTLDHNPTLREEKKYIDHIFEMSDSECDEEGIFVEWSLEYGEDAWE